MTARVFHASGDFSEEVDSVLVGGYVFSLHVGSPIIPLFALGFSMFVFQLYWKLSEDFPLSLSFAFGF